jgi:hypothetical protein
MASSSFFACAGGGTSPAGPGLWGTSSSDMWAGNLQKVALHFDGAIWTEWQLNDNRRAALFWGTSSDDIWASEKNGAGYLGHWDGTGWDHVGECQYSELWMSDEGDLWTAGNSPAGVFWLSADAGVLACPGQFDGIATAYNGIWGSSASDVWAVGPGGALGHWDGASWTTPPSPTTQDLNWAWGTSPQNIWAVGAAGTIVHYNGSDWTTVASPTGQDLYGVAGNGADAWAVGDGGTLLELQ